MIVGYLSGVFDLFHVGHLNIIQRAKGLCDYLIVGVSTDELCARYKGHKPTIPFEERTKIVSAIKYVDKVICQKTLDKTAIVQKYGIQKIFHGDDIQNRELYKRIEESVKEYGAEVLLLPYTANISSTDLNKKRQCNNINYRSVNDMDFLIRTNCYQVANCIDFIVGVPKSGLLAATILATQLNIPMLSCEAILSKCSVNQNINDKSWKKKIHYEPNGQYRVLLIDDSTNEGTVIRKLKEEMLNANEKLVIQTLAIYATTRAMNKVDLFFELLEQPRVFEWNLLHNKILERTMIPASLVLSILEKFEKTGLFLKKIGLLYNDLDLSNEALSDLLADKILVGNLCKSEKSFSDVYMEQEKIIFSIVESDDWARKINHDTNKPVLSFYLARCYQ